MTRDDINNLTGHAADVACARALGLLREKAVSIGDMRISEFGHVLLTKLSGDRVWSPSTVIADAMPLLAKLRAEGWEFYACIKRDCVHIDAIRETVTERIDNNPTLELAIVRAFLIAGGAE